MTDVQLTSLDQQGIVAIVHVKKWETARSLSAEDLGLDLEGLDEGGLIQLGRKRLVPPSLTAKFGLLESRARGALTRNSYRYMEVLRFIPNTKLHVVKDQILPIVEEFEREVEVFLDDYEAIKEQSIAAWETHLRHLRAREREKGSSGDVSRFDTLMVEIRESYPPVDEVRKKFGMKLNIFAVIPPGTEIPGRENVHDWEETRQERRRIARECAEGFRGEVDEFTTSCMRDLMAQTSKVLGDAATTLSNGQPCNQRSLNRLGRLVEDYKEMNFMGESDYQQQLEDFQTKFLSRQAADYRSNSRLLEEMNSGLEDLQATANKVVDSLNAPDVTALGARRLML